MIYLPVFNAFLRKRWGIRIPAWFKIGFGILVIWGTLGVGDLMEWFEARR
ncbi:MAG: hypothetical protein AAFW89_11070 [Bacteroidota bacterium]